MRRPPAKRPSQGHDIDGPRILMLLRTCAPRPYRFVASPGSPTFDRFEGPGVLLFSALDTDAEMRIARALDEQSVPSAVVPMPRAPQCLELSTGSLHELSLNGRSIPLERIGAVWAVSMPEIPAAAWDDAAIHAFRVEEWRSALADLLGTVEARWMNPAGRAALSRTSAVRLASELGFRVPRTLVTNDAVRAVGFCEALGGTCVAKRVGHRFPTRPNGDTLPTFTRRVSVGDLTAVALHDCPVLLQEAVARTCEYRCYVVEEAVFVVRISAPESVDWREEPETAVIEPVALDRLTNARLRALARALTLPYVAVDLLGTADGAPYFLEANPHGNFAFCDELFTPTIAGHIAAVLASWL